MASYDVQTEQPISDYANLPVPGSEAEGEPPKYYGTGGGTAADALKAFGHYVSDIDLTPGEVAEQIDRSGKAYDPMGSDQGTGLTSLPNDIIKVSNSKPKSDDRFVNVMNVLDDVGTATNFEPISDIANIGKGTMEIGKGATGLADAKDADAKLEATKNLVNGVGDFASGVPEEHVNAAGKAFKVGLEAGNRIAPVVFGDNKTSSDVLMDDGTYAASTGNRVVDWVAGAGKYSQGRLEDHAMGQGSIALRAELDKVNKMEAEASPEEAERIRETRAQAFAMMGVKDPEAE